MPPSRAISETLVEREKVKEHLRNSTVESCRSVRSAKPHCFTKHGYGDASFIGLYFIHFNFLSFVFESRRLFRVYVATVGQRKEEKKMWESSFERTTTSTSVELELLSPWRKLRFNPFVRRDKRVGVMECRRGVMRAIHESHNAITLEGFSQLPLNSSDF